MNDFRLDPRASRDIVRVVEYIAADNVAAALKWREELIDRLILLAKNPYMGERRPDLAVDLRALSFGSYVIYFRPKQNFTEIVRIIHGARDIRRSSFKPPR